MAPTPNQSTAKLPLQKHRLDILKGTAKPSQLTQRQSNKNSQQREALGLWKQVLEEFQRCKLELDVDPEVIAKQQQPSSRHHDYLRFLDLPGEMRNRIYEIYVADDEEVRSDREREISPRPLPYRRPGSIIPPPRYSPGLRDRPAHYTHKQTVRQRELEKLVDDICEGVFSQYPNLSDGTRTAFLFYKNQHTMDVARYFHEERHPTDQEGGTVFISERGSLCDDLPFLALTCRQIFREMWGILYPSTKKKPLRFKARVRNTNFFPFFRFVAMLQELKLANVNGDQVSIDFREIAYGFGLSEAAEEMYKKKFDNVKRLIEMHWLDGLPLWGCFTGLHGDEGAPDFEKENEDMYDDYGGYDEDGDEIPKPWRAKNEVSWIWCDGPASRSNLENWLYAVRQVVALYRINLSKWRKFSLEYNHAYRTLTNAFDEVSLDQQSDADLVEAVINALSQALKYHLGYEGDFEDGSKNNYFQFAKRLKEPAGEKEYACVNLVNEYCAKIDKALKAELEEEAYDEWEKFEDEKKVPMGLLF